jgi:hypothetical protein
LDDLDGDCWKKCDEYYKTLEQPDAGWHINWSTGYDGYFELYGATKSRMEYYKQSYTYSEPLRIDYSNKKWTFQKKYLDELDWQRSVAETISLMSPSELFRFVCSAICRTNVESQYRFMNRVRVYREVFINYLKDKKIFSSFSYITPVLPETFKTNYEVKKLRELNKYKSPNPNDYPYLDISDVPVFQLQSDGILFDVRNALFKIITLLIISIILFWLSFVSFTKYDVR